MSKHSSKYVSDNHTKGKGRQKRSGGGHCSSSSGYFESSMDDSEDLNLICVSDHENGNDNNEDVTFKSPLRKRGKRTPQPSPTTPASQPPSPYIPICPGLSPSSNLRKYLTENEICIRRIKELYSVPGWDNFSPPPGYTPDMDNIGWKEPEERVSPVLKRVREGKRRRRRYASPGTREKVYTASQKAAKRVSANSRVSESSLVQPIANEMDENDDEVLYLLSQRIEEDERARHDDNKRKTPYSLARDIRHDSAKRRLPLELQEITMPMPATPGPLLQEYNNYNSQPQDEGSWGEDDEGDAIMSQITLDESPFPDKSVIRSGTEISQDSVFDDDEENSLLLSCVIGSGN